MLKIIEATTTDDIAYVRVLLHDYQALLSVDRLFVRPDMRGLGVGKALVSHLLNEALAIESPRDLWRLQLLREWSYEQVKQVFPRSA